MSTICEGMDRPDAHSALVMDPFYTALEARLSMKFPPVPHKSNDDKDATTTSVVPGEDDDLIAEMRSNGLRDDAQLFRDEYRYGSNLDRKTFVCRDRIHLWEDQSSGIVWVGVHGMDSICVVTRTGDLDLTRVHRDLKYLTLEEVLFKFRKTVISEIEDLASPSSKLREIVGPSTWKPFGVVSVIHGTDNDHQDSGHEASSDDESEEDEEVESSQISSDECLSNEEFMDRVRKSILKQEKREEKEWPVDPGYDETTTIKYLREQMRKDTTFTINETIQESNTTEYDETEAIHFLLDKMETTRMEAFTVDETIKTAISAFQHLFRKEFKANEIEVTVMDPKYFFSKKEPRYKDLDVKELVTSDIEDHLAAINEPGASFGSWCHISSCSYCRLGFKYGGPLQSPSERWVSSRRRI